MKWVVDEKAHWWKDKLMKWPNIKNQQKFKLIGMQVDKMAHYESASWWNEWSTKRHIDEIASWWNVVALKKVDENSS
jgi:hypothetical protein